MHGWSYRWNPRYRAAGERIFASYAALWAHFDAKPGPAGWLIMPIDSEEKLAATALSTEKRARQTKRADYWIRTRNLLRARFKLLLQRPHREPSLARVTQSMERDSVAEDTTDFQQSEPQVPERVLQTGPGTLF